MNNNFDLNSWVRPSVAQLAPYSSARDEYKDISTDMIFLDANENPFDTGINRYPDPQQTELKEMLASQRNISTKQLLLGNGSDEVLDLLFRAFCEPHTDEVILTPPTYGMYKVLAGVNAVKQIEVPLLPSFELDVLGIKNNISEKTKMIFLCSPNNPTGNILNVNDIQELLSTFRGLVIIDEAYVDFSETQSWTTQLHQYPNLVITQTLSKAYGMAGIRLGLCIASKEIISVLNKIKPPYNINLLTQQKALEFLQKDLKIKERIAILLFEKKKLSNALADIRFVKTVYPSQANFLLVKVDDATKRYNQLIKKGVVVRNRTNQHLCTNCLRFTVGTPDENQKLISILKSL